MGNRRRRSAGHGFLALAVGTAAALAAAACGGHSPHRPARLALSVDRPSGPAYDPVLVRVVGADPGSSVTLTATAADAQGRVWTSKAAFRADAEGVVDPARQAPASGSYSGVDQMGLFWSMDPPAGSGAEEFETKGFTVTVTAADDGATASGTVKRDFEAQGETVRALTVAQDGFEGHLFLPPGISTPRPALLMVGGSEGGESPFAPAMLAASKGWPVLSVGYFNVPGTPPSLKDIPLEYFAKAAAWLGQQPQVDKRHVVISGVSRGSEAALLTSQYFPDLVHGTVLIAPSSLVWGAFPGPGDAWTLKGAPVAAAGTDIPVDKVDGPVEAFAGTDDQLWEAQIWAPRITGELDQAHNPYPHTDQEFQDAGHMVGGIPWLPLLTTHTQYGKTFPLGGTRQANAAAQAQVWKARFALLAAQSG